jgi:CheY-like chemotaxis protein
MDLTARETTRSALAVLVVDDDLATRVLLKKVLTRSGFAVDLAAGGSEALQLALTGEYAAILLDLVMPQPDGLAVLRQITSAAPTLLRKIIIIAGYPQQVVATDTYAMLSKPLDVAEVVRLTRRCTEQ